MLLISIKITEIEKCMGNWKNFDGDDLHVVYYYFALLEILQLFDRCRLRAVLDVNTFKSI